MRRTLGRAEVRQRDPRLDPVDRDLLNILDRRAMLGYGDGRIGAKVLAAALHRTDRTVRRHMARLEALGYVTVRERANRDGGPAVNCYRVGKLRGERDEAAVARRAAARAERDRARKEPRRRRAARHRAAATGGVLTRVTPALTRGRVNVPSGTGEICGRPPVPVGQARKTGVDVMPERFGELGPNWGGGSRDEDVSPGRGRVTVRRPDPPAPPLTEDQLTAAALRGSPVRIEDVIEARIRGRLSPADEGLSNAEIARYNARAAATWERERAGRPRPRPRPRHRR